MAADYIATSDMDAFLINPTIMASPYIHHSADDWIPSHPLLKHAHYINNNNDDVSKELIRDFSRKFLLAQEYTSEEEGTTASPSEDNYDSVFGSTSSEGDADSLDSYDDLEIVDAGPSVTGVLPLCAKAQPVYIISAGRAKIISLVSSAEVSPRESSFELDDDSSFTFFDGALTPQHSHTTNNFSRTRSQERRIAPPRVIPSRSSSKRSLPRLDATSTAGPTLSKSFQTPLSNQRASPTKQDPFPADWPLPSSPISPVTPPRRRMPKLFASSSPAISRRKISNGSDTSTSSRASSIDNSRCFVPVRSLPPGAPTPLSLIDNAHRRMYEAPKREKLIPRGAAERVPTLTLPSDADWPLRSIALPEHRGSSVMRDFKRKSTLATAQL